MPDDSLLFDFHEAPTSAPPPETEPKKRGRGRPPKSSVEPLPPLHLPTDEALNAKPYRGIMDVSAMLGIKPAVLRAWERDFDMTLRKNGKGDRFYTPDNIRLLITLRDLVLRRKYTVEGAKEYLRDAHRAKDETELILSLQQLKTFLQELKAHL